MTVRPILVVGENGQLARALGALRRATKGPLVFAGRQRVDLSASISEIIRGVNQIAPSAIINAAAYTAVDKAESDIDAARALNVMGVSALAQAAFGLGIPLIHVSTDYVFAGDKSGPYEEDDPVRPLSVYGATKAEGEAELLASGCAGAIVRTSWVYSPFGANFVKTMMRLAETRDEVRVVADQHGRPTHAGDLARACVDLAELWIEGKPTQKVLHYAGAGDATWADVAEETFLELRRLGRASARVVRISTEEYGATPARRPSNSRLNTSRIESLGISTRPWRDGVRDCVRGVMAVNDEVLG